MTDRVYPFLGWLLLAGIIGAIAGLISRRSDAPQEVVVVNPVATIVFEDVPGARCYILTRFEWTDEDGKRRWSVGKEFSCIPWEAL